MNPDTVHLIQRSYSEVTDDILTSLVGGVVNEPIIFDVKSELYSLARPATGVRGITGIRETDAVNGTPVNHSFQQTFDFEYDADLGAIRWLDGDRPVDGSLFFVDYVPADSSSPITDINVGGVARTLSEAVGREIATVYEQLNRAYRFGFVDTSEGKALDLVVSILGVTRKQGDFAVGLVTFFRDDAVPGDITIASGTALTAKNGAVRFETSQQRTLQRGQARIDVPVRAAVGFAGETGRVDANAIDTLERPIAGILSVRNLEPTFLGAAEETDDELRARARAELFKLGNATLPAIDAAVQDSFATVRELWDPNGPVGRRSTPGSLTLLVEAEPERFATIDAGVAAARAAGIVATIVARYVFVTPKVVVEITAGLPSEGKQKVVDEVIAAVGAYVEPLSSGDPFGGRDLLDAIKAVVDVKGAQVVDVQVARSDVAPQKPATVTDAVVDFMLSAPPQEETELRNAVDGLLFGLDVGAPTGDRIPDRSLLRAADGVSPATDADIEAGEFLVVPEFDGQPGWIVADMDEADIALREAGL